MGCETRLEDHCDMEIPWSGFRNTYVKDECWEQCTACNAAHFCPAGSDFRPNVEVWPGRSCSYVLEKEGGWPCSLYGYDPSERGPLYDVWNPKYHLPHESQNRTIVSQVCCNPRACSIAEPNGYCPGPQVCNQGVCEACSEFLTLVTCPSRCEWSGSACGEMPTPAPTPQACPRGCKHGCWRKDHCDSHIWEVAAERWDDGQALQSCIGDIACSSSGGVLQDCSLYTSSETCPSNCEWLGSTCQAFWFVVWHVQHPGRVGHAVGDMFSSKIDALAKFKDLSWLHAAVLYDKDLTELKIYGRMSPSNWQMLKDWAENQRNMLLKQATESPTESPTASATVVPTESTTEA